jgi:hypothetical protein
MAGPVSKSRASSNGIIVATWRRRREPPFGAPPASRRAHAAVLVDVVVVVAPVVAHAKGARMEAAMAAVFEARCMVEISIVEGPKQTSYHGS